MQNEEKIEGVLEMASFSLFKEYEIEFIEKVAQNIASVVATIKRNSLTEKLLEESTIHAEELRSQEEEMKQSVEELHATQEEYRRREMEYQQTIQELSSKLESLKKGVV